MLKCRIPAHSSSSIQNPTFKISISTAAVNRRIRKSPEVPDPAWNSRFELLFSGAFAGKRQ
jgi:hypothetical protein